MAEVLNLCSPGPGNVSFSLNGTTYQNNSLVTLEDIGGGENVLLCVTDLADCCRRPYTGEKGPAMGNWFFPNGSRVPSSIVNETSKEQWDIYRTRGQSVVRLHRRRGGEDGVYRCEIPDAMNVTQKIYIGVYTANTGEWYIDTLNARRVVTEIVYRVWVVGVVCSMLQSSLVYTFEKVNCCSNITQCVK